MSSLSTNDTLRLASIWYKHHLRSRWIQSIGIMKCLHWFHPLHVKALLVSL